MKRISALPLVIAVLFLSISADAQDSNSDVDSQRLDHDALLQKYKQLQVNPSATLQDAALDADVIVGLLQNQPALALQIKKVLIRDAFDQGRLLQEDDLTDAVL